LPQSAFAFHRLRSSTLSMPLSVRAARSCSFPGYVARPK
jgi:hypothetical protein